MKRLTREKDKFECRINYCEAEDWFYEKTGIYPKDVCDNCPFMKYINKLAEKEDEEKGAN